MVLRGATRLLLLACAACGARTELAGLAGLVDATPPPPDASNADAPADASELDASCPHVDAGMFACGDAASCNSSTEYCHEVAGGPPPGVDLLKCVPLPNGCSTCVGLQTQTCFCKDDNGRILVTCPVP